jgi:hypothetical protein
MISLDHPSILQDEIRGMENCFNKIDISYRCFS